ncbi:type II toxin-antitoxin system prevent-host-death family antitoxin [Prosthecobacter sp.]|uniref:type II toxin-antitoxin system prevent-host-death family antitoxin n=1 Tax=Prosthecobacter sp. TaxID=1965333 RepID=UPI002ABCB71B|nr:type II toxin-antitoxin system prevent-host-death family antitoxin [Prosthecobacter sp.]MDZ4402884.1 type II toxin-antitoxin system prevent-host-death family antitoxin [Prosthecobacter sp.]
MNMLLAKDIVSVTDFARGTKEHLAEMAVTNRPRVLTQNGKAAAVVMSVEMYDEMSHDAYERKMDMELKMTLEAYARGERGRPLDEVFGDLERKHFSKHQAK